MRVAGLILAVLVAGFAIRWFGRPEDDGPTTTTPKEHSSGPENGSDSSAPPQQPAPKYPGKPLTEGQARQVIETFAHIRVPDVPLVDFASGVESERLGTRGHVSFRVDSEFIPAMMEDFRKIGTALAEASPKKYYFSENVGSVSWSRSATHPHMDLDESTHKFVLTSRENRLVLPEEISKALGLEPERYTKDFQLFLYLCTSNGTFRMSWQHYPD